MDVTLKQIRAFAAVAQAGSFTAAAQRLHLTQSAVSVLISECEQVFGLRLFDRTTRQVQLTEAGREFRPVAEKVLSDVDFDRLTAALFGVVEKTVQPEKISVWIKETGK